MKDENKMGDSEVLSQSCIVIFFLTIQLFLCHFTNSYASSKVRLEKVNVLENSLMITTVNKLTQQKPITECEKKNLPHIKNWIEDILEYRSSDASELYSYLVILTKNTTKINKIKKKLSETKRQTKGKLDLTFVKFIYLAHIFCHYPNHELKTKEIQKIKVVTNANNTISLLKGKNPATKSDDFIMGSTYITGGFGKIRPAIRRRDKKHFCIKEVCIREHCFPRIMKQTFKTKKKRKPQVSYNELKKEFTMMSFLADIGSEPPQLLLETSPNNQKAYLVTKWLLSDLATICNHIAQSRRVDVALTILIESLKTLKRYHQKQVVHQDIKLENIMISPVGSIEIIDFGHAHLTTTPLRTGGTLGYHAPEQLGELIKKSIKNYPFKTTNTMLYQQYLKQEQILLPNELNPEDYPKRDVFSLAVTICCIILPFKDLFRNDTHYRRESYQNVIRRYLNYLNWYQRTSRIKTPHTDDLIYKITTETTTNYTEESIKSFFIDLSKKSKPLFLLLWKMLNPNPKARITAEEAMTHTKRISRMQNHIRNKEYLLHLAKSISTNKLKHFSKKNRSSHRMLQELKGFSKKLK